MSKHKKLESNVKSMFDEAYQENTAKIYDRVDLFYMWAAIALLGFAVGMVLGGEILKWGLLVFGVLCALVGKHFAKAK
jgi:hypothetical protein